jgi:exopolysaccharide production protein ExoQ
MGIIALSLALIFAATLIVRDCKRRPSVSLSIWIPTIFVMVLGSRSASEWLHGGTGYYQAFGNQAATDPIDLIFTLTIIVTSLVITIRRRVNWGKVFAANPALMLLYGYFVLSIGWSGDPMGSFKRIFKDFGMLFVIGVVFSEKDPAQAMRAMYLRSASLMLPLSLVFIRWFPRYGRVYALDGSMTATGVTTQKNTLGEMTLIYILFLVWDYLERPKQGQKSLLQRIPWDQVVLLLMSLWLLRASQSKSSLLCLVIGVFLIARWKSLASTIVDTSVFLGALASPLLLFFSQQFSSVIAPLVQAMGRNMTFTGRANIWQHITLDTVNPLIGCGYYNFWGGPGGYAITVAMDTTVPNAHNGYLDLYLDGGFIGLAIFAIVLIASGRGLIRRLARQAGINYHARICFAVLIVVILSNLSESTFVRVSLLWFTTLLMIVRFPGKGSLRNAHINVSKSAYKSPNGQQSVLVSR